jgi:hypothetical protein
MMPPLEAVSSSPAVRFAALAIVLAGAANRPHDDPAAHLAAGMVSTVWSAFAQGNVDLPPKDPSF